ncbi:MAG: hypothetical protein H0W68_09635 [Gemmatimonadaceae bacterium]|nr:hypothetical protein [Gemmatimonadaceae bacterium]
MPKSDASLKLDDYAPVADRIDLFYSRYSTGRITTKLLPGVDREVVVKAFVYRRAEDSLPAATGLASERIGDGEINMHSCLENTETSAIGRALANLGFAASRKRPSREEMEKVERARSSVAYRSGTPNNKLARVAEPLSRNVVLSAIHHDLLLVLDQAQGRGFPHQRSATIRRRLSDAPQLSIESSMRLERAVRGWLVRHSGSAAGHP